jgi:HEAT repeat protein
LFRTLFAGALVAALAVAGCEAFDTPEQLHERSEREAAARKAEETGRARADLRGDPSPAKRADAARRLGKLEAKDAVPDLAAALRDSDPTVRAAAGDALRALGAAAADTVPALRTAIAAETDGRAIVAMGWALIGLQVDRRELVQPLQLALRHPDIDTRFGAALALRGLVGPMELVPVYIEAMGTPIGRAQAIGNTPESILVQLVRRTGDRRLIPPLLEALERGTPAQRGAVAIVLSAYFESPHFRTGAPEPLRPIVPALAARLRDPEPEVRAQVAHALALIGPPGKPAAPALLVAVTDPDAAVRENAAWALGGVGRDHQPVPGTVPALVRALGDPSPKVRASAARALGESGAPARPAVADLTRVLAGTPDGDEEVRAQAATALSSLGRAGVPDVLPPLVKAFRDPAPLVRTRAAAGAGQLGRAGAPAVPDLAGLLRQDADAGVRAAAAAALGNIGPAARDGLPALRAALGDPHENVRRLAQESIKRITEGP